MFFSAWDVSEEGEEEGGTSHRKWGVTKVSATGDDPDVVCVGKFLGRFNTYGVCPEDST